MARARAASKSTPARRTARRDATAPQPWRRRALVALLVLAIALPSAAFGTVLPDLAERGRSLAERVVPGLGERSLTVVAAPMPAAAPAAREFPRELAGVREQLDAEPPPAVTRELLSRLGILGDPREDFDRIATRMDHPNRAVVGAAAQALGRLGGRRALDRLSVSALSLDQELSAAGISGLGLLADDGAVDVLQQVIRKPDTWRRQLAMDALALRGGPQARRVLHTAFRKANAGEAWGYAQAIASLGEKPDLRLLVLESSNPASPRRDAALSALSTIADPRADGILLQLARTTTGPARWGVLGALGAVRDPEAIEILTEALTDPRDRGHAIGALGQSRAPGALDALIEAIDLVPPNEAWGLAHALVSRPEPQAREVLAVLAREEGPLAEQAMSVLANAGDERVGAILLGKFDAGGVLPPETTYNFLAQHGGEDGWSLLEEVLADGSTEQRNAVVWALQNRGDADAVERLLDLAKTEDQWVGQTAMSALEGLGDEARSGLSDLLLTRLDDPDANFEMTASTLGRLNTPEARDALLTRLGEADSMETGSIVRALGQMDDPAARAALLERMQHEDDVVRSEAFHAMLWGAGGINADALEVGLADPSPDIRAAAVGSLAQSGRPDAVESLLGYLEDDDPAVSTAALSALGQTGSPEAEEALVAALDDPDTAQSAMWSLQSLNTKGARAAIREQLDADDPQVRVAAIGAMGSDSSRSSQEALRGALQDDDPSVASTALSTLSMWGGRGNAQAVAELLESLPSDSEDPYGLRYQAASVLQGLGGSVADQYSELIGDALTTEVELDGLGELPLDDNPWELHEQW